MGIKSTTIICIYCNQLTWNGLYCVVHTHDVQHFFHLFLSLSTKTINLTFQHSPSCLWLSNWSVAMQVTNNGSWISSNIILELRLEPYLTSKTCSSGQGDHHVYTLFYLSHISSQCKLNISLEAKIKTTPQLTTIKAGWEWLQLKQFSNNPLPPKANHRSMIILTPS